MKKINFKKYNKTVLYIFINIILIGAVFCLGVYWGNKKIPDIDKINLFNKETGVDTNADFAPFWKAWNMLEDKSIYREGMDDQDKVWGAIQGLANSYGDPYTVFFDPEENKSFSEEIKGSFSGIGAEMDMKDGILTVISPLRNTPAWNAGIKAGDRIVKIDNKTTEDMTVDEAISLIRGEKGTTVILSIYREEEPKIKDIKVVRDIINFPIIDTEEREDGIFIIKFYSFSENSFYLFTEAIKRFYESDKDKLILDLRGNPGGYLESAVSIASYFLEKGSVIVREDFGDGNNGDSYRSRGGKLFDDNLKMVILVDGGSASASEILAGALREYGIATLVGEQTFGKGSVQELVKITEDTSLKVTVAKWLTPKGISISEKGLTPDVVVPISIDDIKSDKDPQMDKAIEILLSK